MKNFCLILVVVACLGQQTLAKSLRTSAEDNTVETTTYDWGKHTDPSRTTYDWGKHTQTTEHPGESTTYDWGKHTDPTRTTYDWGKHTGSTYDWGKHTSTSTVGPNGTTTTTASPDDDHHNNHTDYRCSAGKYACAGTVGMCIDLKKICDAVVDCPHADDEQPSVCHFHQKPSGDGEAKYRNQFSGTGFMFQVRNIKVKASKLQMFDQDSLNTHEDSNEAK